MCLLTCVCVHACANTNVQRCSLAFTVRVVQAYTAADTHHTELPGAESMIKCGRKIDKIKTGKMREKEKKGRMQQRDKYR